MTFLHCFIRVHDEGNEQAEYHIDEEADERVKIDATVDPHNYALIGHFSEGGKHIVTINKAIHTLDCYVQCSELDKRTTIMKSLMTRGNNQVI